jgi:hypothetical protein
VFGLDPVGTSDARLFDGLPDAMLTCPPIGVAPHYSSIIRQAFVQTCVGYTLSADSRMAIARCQDVDGTLRMFQAPAKQIQMTLARGAFPVDTTSISVGTPRLAPEGDVLLLDTFDLDLVVSTYMTFHHDVATDTWLRGPDAGLPQYGTFSVPSRAPDRHVLFYQGGRIVQEWHAVGTLATWSHVRDYDIGTADQVRGAYLSPDGLRTVLTIRYGLTDSVRYADRQAIDDAFSPLVDIGLPGAIDPFMTADCNQVFMSSVETVFYVAER